MIPNSNFLDGLHIHQKEALYAFDSGLYNRFLTEWARRHRKTTLWLNISIREACRYPNCSYGHIFPYQKEARETVWDAPDMLFRYLPDKREMDWTASEQKMLVKFENGSILQIGGADNPDSWRGPEWIGVVFDEAKHIKEQMWTTIIRPVMAGDLLPEKVKLGVKRWVAFCYTPEGNNWTTQIFDQACMLGKGGELPDCGRSKLLKKGYYASRLDAEIAGILNPQALAEAREEMPDTMYAQEMRCARLTEEERTLITSLMLNELNKVNWEQVRRQYPLKHKIVSIDPAFGGDMCVLKGFENVRCLETERYHPHKTSDIVFAAKEMAKRLGTRNFIVDCIGIGRGVADSLDDDVAGYNVQFFNSAEKPTIDDDLYFNKRAEAYCYVSKLIRKQKVETISDKELLRQLPKASRYRVKGGKCLMVSKDIIKEDLGCSPDDADAYVMGIYGIQFVEPEGYQEDFARLVEPGVKASEPMSLGRLR